MDQNVSYGFDADGFETLTSAIMDTINTYPGLDDGERFTFSTIPNEEGLTVIAATGALIVDHHESITDHVWETCNYPFTVLYRASGLNEKRKIAAKEWLDTLAKWLQRQTVTIDGNTYQLRKWPMLSGDRRIKTIMQQSPAYLASMNEDKSENWIMNMAIQYYNEYDR